MPAKRLVCLLATVGAVVTAQHSASQACIPQTSSVAYGFLAGTSPLPRNAKGLLYIGTGTTSAEDFEIRAFRSQVWVKVPVVAQHHKSLHRPTSPERYSYDRKTESTPLQIAFEKTVFPQHYSVVSIAPAAGFVVGERYRIRTNTEERIVRVSEESLDLSKVRLKVATSTTTGAFDLPIGCGHTAHFRAAQVKLSAQLPKRLAQYKEHLLYQTLVDGQLWEPPFGVYSQPIPGRSRHSTGEDIVYMDCNASLGSPLTPGLHSVAMRVYFPTATGTQTLESPPVKVHLTCS